MALYTENKVLSTIQESSDNLVSSHREEVNMKAMTSTKGQTESDYTSLMNHIKRISDKKKTSERQRSTSYSSPTRGHGDLRIPLYNSELREKSKNGEAMSLSPINNISDGGRIKEVDADQEDSPLVEPQRLSINSQRTSVSQQNSDKYLDEIQGYFGQKVNEIVANNRLKIRRVSTKLIIDSPVSAKNIKNSASKPTMYDKRIETEQRPTKDQKCQVSLINNISTLTTK